jgi:hypothetical protein
MFRLGMILATFPLFASAVQQVTFRTPTAYLGSSAPDQAVIGDFNGDGIPDVVVTDAGGQSLPLLPGDGKGGFGPPLRIDAGIDTSLVLAADFNGDGNLDLIAACGWTCTNASVVLLLGNGDGTFAPPIPLFSTIVSAMGTADFNDDGIPDLYVTGSDGSRYSYLGNGDGTFRLVFNSGPTDFLFGGLAFADMDRDGNIDLVEISDNGMEAPPYLRISRGNGDGTFKAPVKIEAGVDASCLVVGDFNGDGWPDVAVCSSVSNFAGFTVLINSSGGTFTSSSYFLGANPRAIATADLNGDGRLDLVTEDLGEVSTLLGNGDGTFGTPSTWVTAGSGRWIAALPLAQGGTPSIVYVPTCPGCATGPNRYRPEALSTIPVAAGGNLQATPMSSATYFITSQAVADFDGDGHLDVAVGLDSGEGVDIFLGDGKGAFGAPLPVALPTHVLTAGDLNGDGFADLAVIPERLGNPVVSILLSNGDGTFQPEIDVPVSFVYNQIYILNVNGDRIPDLVLTSSTDGQNSVQVLLGLGHGKFNVLPVMPVNAGGGPAAPRLVWGDFNNDGHLDLLIVNNAPGEGTGDALLLGNGDGTFRTAMYLGSATGGPAVASDFNHDGNLDIVSLGNLLLGNGNGTFQPPVALNGLASKSPILTGDFNFDGNVDILYNKGTLALGNGDGTFTLGPAPDDGGFLKGDVNGDGRPDLIMLTGTNVGALLNTTR